MTQPEPREVAIRVSEARAVSGLLQVPDHPRACLVLAHGAGAGMTHPFMAAASAGLAARGVATLRYQFPYMEGGLRRPDVPGLAHATVRAAAGEAARLLPALPLFAGGKSFGGRMTSQAQAGAPLPGVRGLAFIGFPLHPPRRPSVARAEHLSAVDVPMLFLQGGRDQLAAAPLVIGVVEGLGGRATLSLVTQADHSFHVPARSEHTDAQVMAEILDVLAAWLGTVGAPPR